MKRQNPLEYKRKSQVDSNTNPYNNEEFGAAKKSKISPDESLTELKKEPAIFDVEKAACWDKFGSVPFMFMAKALDAISNESDTIVITDILCNMLRTVIETSPGELVAVMSLLSESILPPDEDTDIHFAIAEEDIQALHANPLTAAKVLETFKKFAKDMQDMQASEAIPENPFNVKVVETLQKYTKALEAIPVIEQENSLTVVEVFETFKKLTKTHITEEDKKGFIKELSGAATGCELQYLFLLLQRMLQGGSQLGFTEQTLLTALGHAALYSQHGAPQANDDNSLELDKAAKLVKEAHSVVPVYDKLVPYLLLDGVLKLRETCTIAPGIPFRAMLPLQTIGSVSQINDKYPGREFICEYEHPGERCLIHWTDNGHVEVYNSHGIRTTEHYIGVSRAVLSSTHCSVSSFILDCYLYKVESKQQKVRLYATDILYHNGKLLLQETLKSRRELLQQSFREQPGRYLKFAATASESTDITYFQKILDESGCSGLIFKTLDSTYEPGKSSENWLGLKKDYVENIHPLELVPIAAFRDPYMPDDGYTFLLACYDSLKEEFQSICLMGWEVPEAIRRERFASLRSKVIFKPQPNYKYPKTMRPAVWFEPTEVWAVREIIYVSPPHPAAFGTADAHKGIMLRHPFSVCVLPDKNPMQASSPDKVVELYEALTRKKH